MLQVKIEDVEFAHTTSSCGLAPKYFGWFRGPEPRPTCFFTDTCLPRAAQSASACKVAWLLESPVVNPKAYRFVRNHAHLFDYVLTFDRSLVDGRKYLYYPVGGCWIPRPAGAADWPVLPPKRRNVSIIASGKKYTKGQKLRHAAIRRFGARMDVYGRGYKPVEFKTEALEDYRFSVVIENAMADDYFTEKIIDCCTLGTVPVYWGTAHIGRYLDERGILRFESLAELGRLLPRLDEAAYAALLPAVRNNLHRSQEFRLAEDWIFEHYPQLFANP